MAVLGRATKRAWWIRTRNQPKQRAGYVVEFNDWPTQVPSPDIPIDRSARVLNMFDELLPQAMAGLRAVNAEQGPNKDFDKSES